LSRALASRIARAVASALLLAGCATTPGSNDASTRLAPAVRAASDRQVVVTIDDALAQRLDARVGGTPRAAAGADAYRGSARAQDLARTLGQDYGLEWVAAWRIDVLGVHCIVYRIPADASREQMLARLRADRRVESAQPLQQFSTSAQVDAKHAAPKPLDAAQVDPPRAGTADDDGVRGARWEDPYFPLQRALRAMRVPEAQALATGRGVRIAIIDTGADLAHPDIAPQLLRAVDFVDDDARRFSTDRHGTAVAGAIAATAGNRLGIVGVAPAARLLLLKACWEDSPALPASCNSLTLAEALAFAIESRAQVINLSVIGPPDPLLARLLQRALRDGIVVVGAEASDTVTQGARAFPAGVPGVLAVRDADLGNGAATRVAIAAPGRAVLTTVPGGHYDYVSGTSMAVALTSGVVALALELRPGLGALRLGQLLRESGTPPTLDAALAVRTLATGNGRARTGRAPAGTPPRGAAAAPGATLSRAGSPRR